MFPERKDGNLKLTFKQYGKGLSCDLLYIEEELTHVIIFQSAHFPDEISHESLNEFYKTCYWKIMRYILLSVDSLGNDQNGYPDVLSFRTLSYEGLKKIRERNLNSNK